MVTEQGIKLSAFAHSGKLSDRSDWQTLADHLSTTAELAVERGARVGLEAAARIAGAWHDFGKHDPEFDRVLRGEAVRVDHSTAGGKLLLDRAKGAELVVAELVAYAILGHHAGLSDARGAEGSMDRRVDQFRDSIPPEITLAANVDLAPALPELLGKLRQGHAGFDLSLAGRMVFFLSGRRGFP